MKKIVRNSMLALAALSIFACNKESEISDNIPESKEIQLIFSSKKPQLTDAETRTEWDGSTITWSKNDAIRIAYTVDDVWQAANGAPESGKHAKMYASKGLSEAAELAQFDVSLSFTDAGNASLSSPVYCFYGVYPSAIAEADFKNPPIIPITIPDVQTPTETSFDSSSDIMYATSEDYDGIPSDRVISLTWNRIVAHADISMSNLQLESEETIENITVTAQNGADLVGTHQLDITTGDVSLPTNGTAINKVVVNATNLAVNSGAVEFWFCSLPFTATELTFTVKTNKYVYVRQFTGLNLSFKGNARNTLSVNMKRAEKFQDYTESFASGQGEFTTTGDPTGIWTASSYDNVNFMKGTSRINNTNLDGEGWLISPFLSILSTESEVSFSHAINGYFGTVSNEATLWVREKGAEWTQIVITYPDKPTSGFTDFEATSASLSAYTGKTIQFGFKYVGSVSTGVGTWEVKDFKVTNAEVVYYPSFEFTSATTKDVSFSASTVQFTYSASHLTSEPTVAVKEGSDDIIDGTPTIANGVITVSVKANNDSETKSATLIVTCEGVDNIPELVINQAAKSDLVETLATIDFTKQGYANQQVVSSLTQDPFNVSFVDGSTPTAYYNTGTAVRVYKGGSLTLSSDYTITKIIITGSSNGGVTLNADGLSGTTWTGSSQSVTLNVNNTSTGGHYRFQKLDITYLAPGSPATTYAVNIDPNIQNGTVTASPSVAAEGTEVNLSVNPATGYVLGALTVKDANQEIISVSNNYKFTMPGSDVTVTATFTVIPEGDTYTLVSSLNDLEGGTYIIAALSSGKYYTIPNTSISSQTFSCIEGVFNNNSLTPGDGTGVFLLTAVPNVSNAFYIYNTTLDKYLVATGSKTFGYVESSSEDYGYWSFSTVSSGGFSGSFSVQHSEKTQYMRAYSNSVRCYDGASNNGVYLFIKEN